MSKSGAMGGGDGDGLHWMGAEWRWNVAGNPGKPVRPGLKICPKSQGVKQCVRSRGKEVTKGSPGQDAECWERGRTCGPRCRWGGRGHRHGSIQREPADPGVCLTSFHSFCRAEGKRGRSLRAGDTADVCWPPLGQAILGSLPGSCSQAGSQLMLPSPLLWGAPVTAGTQVLLCQQQLRAPSGSS